MPDGANWNSLPIQTVAASGTISLPDYDDTLFVVGASGGTTTAATAFSASSVVPGRKIVIMGTNDTDSVTLTHTAVASSTVGTFTSSGVLTLGNGDCITIMQMPNGGWVRVSNAANS